MSKKAVILLSGGLDSSTCLAIAKSEGFECYALSFAYGQRNSCELDAAKKIAIANNVKKHVVIDIDLRKWGGSALTDDIDVPNSKDSESENIPITYVPARNMIFLSLATGWAEVLGAKDIFIRLTYEPLSGVLKGAQLIGEKGISDRINIMALAISQGLTAKEFSQLDFAYSPPFSSVWDALQIATNQIKV
jgi:hypothetical protein